MQPTSFKQTNMVYSKPGDMTDEQCDQLPVYASLLSENENDQMAHPPFSISCWKLTPEEIAEVQRTGKVWVWHVGNFLQPLSLQTQNPFEQ